MNWNLGQWIYKLKNREKNLKHSEMNSFLRTYS